MKSLEQWVDIGINVAVIIVIALVVRFVVRTVIRRSVDRAVARENARLEGLDPRAAAVMSREGGGQRQVMRAKTLGSVLSSVTDVVLLVVVTLMVLGELGVNVGPALASAGIGGVALGFGAQSLVKDVLSGMFLVLENQYGVGDLIKVGDLEGTVQEVGFRVTRLQDSSGSIWYVRNGEIITLGNRTQGWSTSIVSIPVALTSDPVDVVGVLVDVAEGMEAEPTWRDQMLEAPTVLGLNSITSTEMNFTVSLKCPANKQWAVEREFRARAVVALREAGIKGPTPLVRGDQA